MHSMSIIIRHTMHKDGIFLLEKGSYLFLGMSDFIWGRAMLTF
jgi:hypothetical protein